MRQNSDSQRDDNAHPGHQARANIPFPRRRSSGNGNRCQHADICNATSQIVHLTFGRQLDLSGKFASNAPPFLEIARAMHEVKPLAIASSGHLEMVEATLKAVDIMEMFRAIVCAEDHIRRFPIPFWKLPGV